jgi:hypothetical protein
MLLGARHHLPRNRKNPQQNDVITLMAARPHTAGGRVEPIFILSLPRSGSTLLQRALAMYPEVATTSEPWLMLALLAPLHPGTPGDVGWQRTLNTAVGEFIAELPVGERQYLAAAGRFAGDLYAGAASDQTRYFLDKTPPYHWVADELVETFPEGRFIFLWRPPLAVASSIFETWCGARTPRRPPRSAAGPPAADRARKAATQGRSVRSDAKRCFPGGGASGARAREQSSQRAKVRSRAPRCLRRRAGCRCSLPQSDRS